MLSKTALAANHHGDVLALEFDNRSDFFHHRAPPGQGLLVKV
jgi:hypothetical protein